MARAAPLRVGVAGGSRTNARRATSVNCVPYSANARVTKLIRTNEPTATLAGGKTLTRIPYLNTRFQVTHTQEMADGSAA